MISIVILTYNRQDVLEENLEAISKQTFSDREIIVIDNGNNERTKSLLENRFPEAHYLAMASNIGCGARNFGLRYAHGSIIIALDDDVLSPLCRYE